ncbi:MAG: DNA polymerase III subunit alpha, partial [Butyrivibrio sp.]|nr:DNA polymerase III subunit alpha [Butyrivibrio sp.]
MVDFAKYAFNKSHAACYGIIAYQTAWLMYHYPTEYFAAIETSVIGNADKLSAYMGSAKGKGIKNLRPDINLSGSRFLPENDKIRMALCSVSAVSDDTACLIEKDRQQNGPFKDTADAFDRLAALKIGADAIENLIYAGAFDEFEGTRKQKVSVCRDYIDNRKKVNKENIEGQMSLFDIMPSKAPKLTFPSVGEYSAREKLIKEKDATGIYISGHPLDNVSELIRLHTNISSSQFKEEDSSYDVQNGDKVQIVCLLTEIKKHYTKKGDAMAFVTAEDLDGEFPVVLFPKVYEDHKDLKNDDIIILKGHVSIDDRGVSIIADSIEEISKMPKKLWIKFSSRESYNESEKTLLAMKNGGRDNVVIYLEDTKERWIIKNFGDIDDAFKERIETLFSPSNVAMT